MASDTPIYSIAKEIGVDSNRIILACNSLSIDAKGAAKRLNEEQQKKLKHYFEKGKNVSEEIVEINKIPKKEKTITSIKENTTKISYFRNRLIAKS